MTRPPVVLIAEAMVGTKAADLIALIPPAGAIAGDPVHAKVEDPTTGRTSARERDQSPVHEVPRTAKDSSNLGHKE